MQKKYEVKLSQNQLLFDKKILRFDEVVSVLGFSKSHVYKLTSQKKIPFYKKGKTLFFKSDEIVEWINEGVA